MIIHLILLKNNKNKSMTMFYLGIVGGRTRHDRDLVCSIICSYKAIYKYELVVVSGGADGIDEDAKTCAYALNVKYKGFDPDWERFPYKTFRSKAYFMRNTDIANLSNVVYALPSSSSTGTYDTVEKVKRLKKKVVIIK